MDYEYRESWQIFFWESNSSFKVLASLKVKTNLAVRRNCAEFQYFLALLKMQKLRPKRGIMGHLDEAQNNFICIIYF